MAKPQKTKEVREDAPQKYDKKWDALWNKYQSGKANKGQTTKNKKK